MALDANNPLLNTDGTPALRPSGLVRVDRVNVIADDGLAQRSARRLHPRVRPRYTVRVDGADGVAAGAVLAAYAKSKRGALGTGWRAPDDAAGDVASSPRYRFTKGPTVTRARGGVVASIECELERV